MTPRTPRGCILVLGLASLLIGGCSSTGISDKDLTFLGPDQAMEEVQGHKRLLGLAGESSGAWVDVRPAEAFKAGHIPGAINLPLDRVNADHGELSKYDALVVYGESYSDPKAEALSKRLIQLGHESVFTLRGGMQAWTTAGNTTETGE